METESMLTVYAVIVPSYNIFFAFQTPVRVIEPNLNWSIVELRDYSSEAHNHKQGPNPESTVPPSLIFNFNHWSLVCSI